MIRIAQISCGTEYSGVQHEMEKAAESVGAKIVTPEVENHEIDAAVEELGLDVASNDLKVMLARAKSVVEGRCDADGIFSATCFRCAEGALVRSAIKKYIHQRTKLPIITYSFTERTKAGILLLRMEALVNMVVRKTLLAKLKQVGLTGGIDSGSSMTKAAIMQDNQIIGVGWVPTVDIIASAEKALNEALKQAKLKFEDLEAVGATGYGRVLVGKHFNAGLVQEEITVCSKGAVFLANKQKGGATIIDIGGMDNKAITIYDSVPDSFTVGSICAGASGKFMEVCAQRLGTNVIDMGELALRGDHGKIKMNAYCIIFGMRDLVAALGGGAKPEDIAAAACHSVAEQVTEQQLQEIDIRGPVIQVGGTSLIEGLIKAMQETLHQKIVVPAYSPYTGAVGASLLVSGLL